MTNERPGRAEIESFTPANKFAGAPEYPTHRFAMDGAPRTWAHLNIRSFADAQDDKGKRSANIHICSADMGRPAQDDKETKYGRS